MSIYLGLSSKGLGLTFIEDYGRSFVRKYPSSWPITKDSSVFMYLGQHSEQDLLAFQWTAAHEFAHVLGMGDAYEKGLFVRSITNGGVLQYWVQPNDIRLILQIWKYNELLIWPDKTYYTPTYAAMEW